MRVTDEMVNAARSAYSVDRIPNGEIINKIAGAGYGDKLIRGIIESALSHAAGQEVVVPEGWALVPKGASVAMCEAGAKHLADYGLGTAWADMIDAAPIAPAPASTSAEVGQDGEQCRAASGWRCFHCDEVFTDEESATIHFGTHERHDPACTIDANEYRRMEKLSERFAEEDADCHRAMYRMQSEHQQALRRAEEAGYAKGVRDAEAKLCVLSRGVPEGNAVIPWRDEIDRMYVEGWAQSLRRIKDYRAYFIEHGYHPEYVAVRLERLLAAIAAQRKEGE